MTEEIVIWTQHLPVSVNKAYRNTTAKDGKKRGRIKTQVYTTWLNAFGWDVKRAMQSRQTVEGRYSMSICIDMNKRHKLADLSNFLKTTEDALVHWKVVKDDRFCEHIEMSWGNPEGGTLIRITPLL